MITRTGRVFVAGHGGLVGSAVMRRLAAAGFSDVVTATRNELDLRDQAAVTTWFTRKSTRLRVVGGWHSGRHHGELHETG
jgi:nucleoside-diphosphate-sugar epimerase